MCRLYTISIFYIWNLSIYRVWYPGDRGTNPLWMLRVDSILTREGVCPIGISSPAFKKRKGDPFLS